MIYCILPIAGGTVNISSSDDGLNANGSGNNSLITVSGGSVTVINENGRDADGFDSNGSINITGGNVFISLVGSGTNNALDYGSENGGKCTISGGNVIACGSSQMAEGPDTDSKQGFIMQTVSGNANDTLSLSDKNGEEIISKEIPCSFTSIILSSPDISVGDTVILQIGDTKTEISVDNSSSDSAMGGGMENNGGFNPNQNQNSTPPEKPDGDDSNTTPQMPDGNEERPTPPDFNNNGNQTDASFGMMQPPDMSNSNGDSSSSDDNITNNNENDGQNQNGFGGGDRDNKGKPNSNGEKMQTGDLAENQTKDKEIDLSNYIWLGISIILLGIGIIVVKIKKY